MDHLTKLKKNKIKKLTSERKHHRRYLLVRSEMRKEV